MNLYFLASMLAFQTGPAQLADGVRPSAIDTGAQAPVVREISPEMRGDIQMARKMYREAIETYKAIQPETAVLANKIGIGYQQLVDLESAKKWYERAVKLDKKYSEAINNLGTIYYERKNYRKAINQYKRALVLNPNSASIYSNLGTAYFARKNEKAAFEAFEKAMELDPAVFERKGTTGSLAQDRNVEERAKFHYMLAKSYAKRGQNELAIENIRKSLEEGFKERDKFKREPEFAGLQMDLEFQKIMATEPKVL